MNPNPIDILLVEDNSGDAELALRGLRKHNFANRIIRVKDGAEALDFLFGSGKYSERRADPLPGIILLDMKMPKVEGIQVLERIRSSPLTRGIPVAILTSSAEDPDIEKAYALGAIGYIIKPVNFDNFSKLIANLGFSWLACTN